MAGSRKPPAASAGGRRSSRRGSSSQSQAEAAAAADLDARRHDRQFDPEHRALMSRLRRSRRCDDESQAEASAAADLEARRYDQGSWEDDPEGSTLTRDLLVRLRREANANGRGGGSVDAGRARYFLDASAGNVALASSLYWEVRTQK